MRWPIVFVCATLGLTTFIAPRAAVAEELGPEMIVYLTGGKQIRGSIVESVPGKHYVVIRADGTAFKLPWSAVRAIAPPNGPPPPPEPNVEKKQDTEPTSPAAKEGREDVPPLPLRRPAPSGPMAFVEMKSQKTIQLQWSEDGGRWETACMSPCNRALPVAGTYRIVDEDGRPGKPFELGHDGKVTIQASPRSAGIDALGIVALTGGTIALYGSVLAAEDADDSSPAVAAVFGLSAMILGTILLLTNSSSVQVDQGTTTRGRVMPPRRVPPGGSLFTVHF